MDDALEIVREADSAAQLTGYPQAIIVRDSKLIVVAAASCRDADRLIEVVRPRD